ncbi:hypothetical protein [uncultured Kocuria sp.]|uniref:hypothetical protein n=1 Tax=uncultured Kocuria sp. TaxID=259305 RepID=UPI00260CC67B|nr:hypothetical protein [uncultured Kocuria sp.]
MRRTIPAAVLLALTLTGCDDRPEEAESTPGASPTSFSPPPPVTATPTPTPDGLPTDSGTGSAAPAPDPPGPESVPTPSGQLDGQ